MLQHAVTSPLLASMLVASGLATVGLSARTTEPESGSGRLVLHAPRQCGAFYLTAWKDGPIQSDVTPGHLKPMTFVIRANLNDGCQWRAVETLTPLDDRTYSYAYDEYIDACEPDAEPYIKTPRTGTVTVE